MKKSRNNLTDAEILRQKAEEQLKKKSSKTGSKLSETDTLKLIYELQVHQIELELQNEDILQAKVKADRDKEKYSELYDFAPSGYFTLTKEGKIIELNLLGASMLGKERQRLINNLFGLYVSIGTRQAFNLFLGNIFKGKAIESCEVTISIADNEQPLYVLLTGHLSENSEHSLITLVDITKRKLAELALKESETKLRQLNVDKDRFISILGHDLKNPFNNILGFSEVLIEDIRNLNTDEIEDIAKNINTSAKITNKLLEDILLWARTQQGKIPYKPQKLSLSSTCRNILEILNPSAYAKNIAIYDSSVDHTDVYSDADMLKTILLNLVSNAIKFTYSGGKITINAEQNSENVIISVSDNGIGIPPENLTKLFNISEVLTTKGTAGETGTGLGLLLCKEFVEKHGGKIWVDSEVGKGSQFKFTLPFNSEPKEINVVENIVSSDTADNQLKSLKILITDDDDASRKFLGITIKSFAKEILYAQNGFEAITAYRNNPDIEFILMDIKMPNMDGYEATRQIRQINNKAIIIAQTAYSEPSDREMAKEAGCSDFIAKPINKTLLKELIKKHFDN